MGILVALEHRTTYSFDRRVAIAPHVIRLRPAPHCRTPITSYSLKVAPEPHFLNWQQDPFGNFQARLVFPEPATMLDITVDLIADLTVVNPFDFFLDETADTFPFTYDPVLAHDLTPYLTVDPRQPLTDRWAKRIALACGGTAPIDTVDFLVDVNQRLRDDVDYTTRLEPGVQRPDETLEKRLGSCRDSAWLLVQVLRRMGLAARFMSGYLVQLTADIAALDGPSGPAADFTDLHAWTEVYLPGAGWVGLDPTSGLFAGEGHIPLTGTPEPSSAAPVTGAVGPCQVSLEFSNVVRRIHEDPRVTRPFTDEQWAAIDSLGNAVDARLTADDVRLTMGGEPTFVSIDDMTAPEWTIAADGPHKRLLAQQLSQRLQERFGGGGIVHHGQGKWYPGEPLPRWQTAIVWRADGKPLWQDPTLLAWPSLAQRNDDPETNDERSAAAAQQAAERLAEALVAAFDLPPDCLLPAYEDALLDLWKEARLPVGPPPARDVDPAAPDLNDTDHRRGIVESLDQHSGAPAGWVLPLHRAPGDPWASSRWGLRRGKLVLTPGDSPIGLRLPLDSIGWKAPPLPPEPSPFAPTTALPEPVLPSLDTLEAVVAVVAEPEVVPPTALCIEPRDGQVHVFLPPLSSFDHVVELLGVIEAAASALAQPVVLEGELPPIDPRACRLIVTPDPGVIEVNVHPAGSWTELTTIAEWLDEDARSVRLGTEKFDLDGLHTGTGGGSHLTLGGPTPADSPLLRRPDLLPSIITYWQHHPALSYVFSGRFIGPTSQAPRVDEGRVETLAELEIAFAELDAFTDGAPFWIVDRALRHLLTDITGNTHRAEMCIDKLHSPDGSRGRLGLLELRAFEMPPHPRMALLQALLVRALVSRFWRDRYRHPLVRWGSGLHDRFLLPWYAEADLRDVCADLAHHDIAMDPDWFAPFLEFRFPRIGTTVVAGAEIELRGAIEPWQVLGEEISLGGTSRYVDSSVERMQVLVRGAIAGRHVLTCNGRAVPLRATEEAGAAVAGVRYRAWAPPSALHPTIGVQSPLVFDLVDLWSGRSLGGCTYHVIHPGGLAYDTFPVNANEAEARRVSRFEQLGHTPGSIDLAALEHDLSHPDPDHPFTLDLRRHSRTGHPR